jgi:hypothetical protein
MTDTKKEVINELYDAALLMTGVVGASYFTKKVAGECFCNSKTRRQFLRKVWIRG